MIPRVPALAVAALALAAAGCHKGSAGPAFRFAQPSAVAVFLGYTSKHTDATGPRLWPYAAVANTAEDELRIFDPVDDSAVEAPITIRPLSVPLPTQRPALVVSAPFTPPPGAAPRPDLLVAVGAASSELQLVRTWRKATSGTSGLFDPELGLADSAPVDLGGEILALVATPAVDGSGNVVPDKVRVIAALSGHLLTVVDYTWSGDPTVPQGETKDGVPGGSVTPGAVVSQDLGFEALSLAVDPSLQGDPSGSSIAAPARPPLRNPRFLYAATQDSIGGVQGVGQIDMAGNPPWGTPRALDAHAPTLLVAAMSLWERDPGIPGSYDQVNAASAETNQAAFGNVEGDPVSRVYAYRDPSWCGPTTELECGIVVIDPSTGDLLEDPWHPGQSPKRYLPPIAIPATPVALTAVPPARNPPTDSSLGELDRVAHRFMEFVTGVGARLTTGVLFVPAEDGRSYFADLARWELPSNVYQVDAVGVAPTSVTTFTQSEADLPQIGFYKPSNVADADATNGVSRPTFDASVNGKLYIQLTPGFTPDDVWTVTYQGYLPTFAAGRPATIESISATQLRVALQSSSTSEVVNVFDPALGVRVGDIVEVWTVGTGTIASARPQCPDTSQTNANGEYNAPIEGKIVEVTPPDPGHPGGWLVIEPGDCVAFAEAGVTSCDDQTRGPWKSMPGCWGSLAGGGVQQVRIRAGSGGDPASTLLTGKEFVVVGARTGYAGRATSAPEDAQLPFRFSNDDERVACALEEVRDGHLVRYTADSSLLPASCAEDTCRRPCERAATARRARRQFLTSVHCAKGLSEDPNTRNFCETYYPQFAVASKQGPTPKPPVGTFTGEPPSGPALAFSMGIQPPVNAAVALQLVRGTQLTFVTASGHPPVMRFGGGGNGGPATGPMGATYFDRSYWDPSRSSERYRLFVPFVGDLILDASPGVSNSDTHVLR